MSLHDTLAIEQLHYSARKAAIAEERQRLDMEEAHLDRNMTKLVEVVMAHAVSEIPVQGTREGVTPLPT